MSAPAQTFNGITIDRTVSDGDRIDAFGGLEVVATPGHSPGQIAFYQPERKILFTGDTMMNLWGKLRPPFAMATPDMDEAKRSIQKIAALDVEIACFGHGVPLTQQYQRRDPRFCPADQRATSINNKTRCKGLVLALYSANCSQRHNKERAIMPSKSIRLLLPVLALIAGLAAAACGTAATPEWAAEAQATQVALAATSDHLTAIAPTATFTSTRPIRPFRRRQRQLTRPSRRRRPPPQLTRPSHRRPRRLRKPHQVSRDSPTASPPPIPPTGR